MYKTLLCICLIILIGHSYAETLDYAWKIDLKVCAIYDPWGLTYDWDTGNLWVSDYSSPFIYRITTDEAPEKVETLYLLGGPDVNLGLAYTGLQYSNPDQNLRFLLVGPKSGYGRKIFIVDRDTGEVSEFRNTPSDWIGSQALAFNCAKDVIYTSDWNVSEGAWASPAQSGNWRIWSCSNISGFACSHSTSDNPTILWTVDQNPMVAKLYMYKLKSNGGVNDPPVAEYELPPEMTQSSTGDCAFDGQYLYVVDRDPEGPYIYVFDRDALNIETTSLGSIKSLFR